MGAFLDKPKVEKSNESGSGQGLRYSLATMQGWRVEMEDAHTAQIGLGPNMSDWAFFAVFDGHAGCKVAKFAANSLLPSILGTPELKEVDKILSTGESSASQQEKTIELIRKGMRSGFLLLDEHMRMLPDLCSENERSGSTAVCVLISPTHLFFGNLGDSRALMSRDGSVCLTTDDHKPYNPKERDRIQNAGGSVMIQRVNGSLAVSRALGDYEYKNVTGITACEQLVSPEPDVYVMERELIKDEFVVLACDGIFDVMSNQELADFLRSRLKVTDNLETVCNQALDACLSKGSRDNMSVVLISFPGAPSVSKTAVEAEAKMRKTLEYKIRGFANFCDNLEDLDTDYVLRILVNQDIPDLPPGAGLHAMRDAIDDIVNTIRRDMGLKSAEAVGGSDAKIAANAEAPSNVCPVTEQNST